MMVTFVSQCEKKALGRTRRVLDAFADRIGDNTWQTVITQEGLLAVKKLLRKTATKNTAVSCHWIRSRSRSELVWVVGAKSKFNGKGVVPVNFTESSTEHYKDNSLWKTHKLIIHAATIAGLFHDFGKANILFQKKLDPSQESEKREPYRHEWVSMRLFQAFVDDRPDIEWLDAMANGEFDTVKDCLKDGLDRKPIPSPLTTLKPFAQLIAWIIVSHHRLLLYPAWQSNKTNTPLFEEIERWLGHELKPCWNSYHCDDDGEETRKTDNWTFKKLPYESKKWVSNAVIFASDAKNDLQYLLSNDDTKDFIRDNVFTSHLARLSMMLADHYYSSKKQITDGWRANNFEVYANTYRESEKEHGEGFKQQLDEHLIGVAHFASKITASLPQLKTSLRPLSQNDALEKREDKAGDYYWQNQAVDLVHSLGAQPAIQGFFGLNMASTGKGKTIANAKIMYALGDHTGRTRFSVALGLRTLTLQTGVSFREDMGLTDEELAIAVGGTAFKQLFENAQNKNSENASHEKTGSDSSEPYLDEELYINYQGRVTHSLDEWTGHDKKRRIDGLIAAPVLVSTIDHLMPATEGVKGGKQIAPMLRLLTSDLVIDEPDDFGLSDLPALGRLVNWAGMLGSKVLLSTATLPPAMAFSLFQAYRAGWEQFAKANIDNWNKEISCGWFDEFGASSVAESSIDSAKAYQSVHQRFVKTRIDNLEKLKQQRPPKQIGEVLHIESSEGDFIDCLSNTIHNAILEQHKKHFETDGDKKMSIGLVRMANIDPLVAVAKRLLAKNAPLDCCIHYVIYHSRYPLAIRNHIEKKLDKILNRKKIEVLWSKDDGVGKVLEKHKEKNHIFVVLASPVAEVGRDHDYNWAIIEPSSMRSIIQTSGRVLRHRTINKPLTAANILLLNQNYKALDGREICFERPGFEVRKTLQMDVTYLQGEGGLSEEGILEEKQYKNINSVPRIQAIKQVRKKAERFINLNELEHAALNWQLFSGPKNAKVWWAEAPYWCGEVQRQQKFRDSRKDEPYILVVEDEYKQPYWQWKNEAVYPAELAAPTIKITACKDPNLGSNVNYWMVQEPLAIYSKLAQDFSISLLEVSEKFGELRVIEYENDDGGQYCFHNYLGFYREIC